MSGRRRWLPALLRQPAGLFSSIVLALLVLAAAVSLLWTPRDPNEADTARAWLPPGPSFWLGTDGAGKDIVSQLLAGARVSVVVIVGAALVAGVLGIAVGALASLTARWVREPLAVLIDILIAFPTLLIAMMLAAVFGGSLIVVVAAVGIGYGVSIARVLRAEIAQVAGADFILAARAAGLGRLAIARRHILPNVAPVFIVQLSLSAALALLAEAALSYLGYGAPSGTPSWGRMLAQVQGYISVHPLAALWPGLAITLTVLALNLFGDALREATDPRLLRPSARPMDDADPADQALRLGVGL